MSTVQKEKESESIYEPVTPLPQNLQQVPPADKPVMDIPPDLDKCSAEELEKADQEVPKVEQVEEAGAADAELSPDKTRGAAHGTKQTGFGILRSKVADCADHVKQQIKSVIPTRPKLTQEQLAKMRMGRGRSKSKQGLNEDKEPEEGGTVEESKPDKEMQGEPGKAVEGEVAGETPKKLEETDQDEASTMDECPLGTTSGITKRKYIKHRRSLPQIPNPITTIRNQVEEFKSKLKRSRTPPKRQVKQGKRRRSRSADASRATSTEPEDSIYEDSEKIEEQEEGPKQDKDEKPEAKPVVSENIQAAPPMVKEAIKVIPPVEAKAPIETIPQTVVAKEPAKIMPPPVVLPVELPKEIVMQPPPRPPPPRPASTLSKPMSQDGTDSYQTFPQERPKQKQPQGYVSKFMKEHQDSVESTSSTVSQSDDHDYEVIHDGPGPAKPVRRRRKQPRTPPTPPSFHYNTIAGNEWQKELENTTTAQATPPPARPRRGKELNGSISGSDAGVAIRKGEQGRVPTPTNEPSGATEVSETESGTKVSDEFPAPTTFPRKKRKGPKCLQGELEQRDSSSPRPSNFINIMQGRPLPPPPRPERSRGSLSSLEQSSIELSVGGRHYAQQTLGLGEGLSPIPSSSVVETPFPYPTIQELQKESEPNVEKPSTSTPSQLNMRTGSQEPSSSSSSKTQPPPTYSSSLKSKLLPEPKLIDMSATTEDIIAHQNHSRTQSKPEPTTSSQVPAEAELSDGEVLMTMLPRVSMSLGRVLLRFTLRSLQAMANYVETATSDDPARVEEQRENRKVLLCILLILVVGLILAASRSEDDDNYFFPSWELLMPPPDVW